ncbi:MAG: trans-2-enoyl-CoA reductase family protein [Gammaproteobacteria bacterium]|nr:trans-2-enoyl-CoA reductase family protein [Gammaproteobacteria bacterium]
MVIKPKVRGFICTTTHPAGCEANVNQQIEIVKKAGKNANGPKKVLVIGASTGYGLASRITAAFGSDAATIGVFLEKAATDKKTASAGWYNSAAFDKAAKAAGLYSKSFNGDAFSHEMKAKVVETIKADLGEVDLVVYSLASPVRKHPDSGEVIRSALRPIGESYRSRAIDTNKDILVDVEIDPANDDEIANTIKVMGGEDWELWIKALREGGVLAEGVKTVAFGYIGSDITWPIYWHGTLGKAKEDVDRAASDITKSLADIHGEANVAVLKSVVTQASAAIPVMPIYIATSFKIMKQLGIHEGCIEQLERLYRTQLFNNGTPELDDMRRYRMDDWELREDVQQKCINIISAVTDANLFETTDFQKYKDEFLKLFGFGFEGVDYEADVDPIVNFDVQDV